MRAPNAADGAAVHNLIKGCAPLDTNSVYCNLLQCTHFADTSITAELNGDLVGFISGYLVPGQPDTLFVWQVAVSDQCRGQGLASRMLSALLQRATCSQVSMLETTVTASNHASNNLFHRLASTLNTTVAQETLFDRDRHFAGAHDSEILLRIGPFAPVSNQ